MMVLPLLRQSSRFRHRSLLLHDLAQMAWRLLLKLLRLVRQLCEFRWCMAEESAKVLWQRRVTYWDGHEGVKFKDGLAISL